MELVLFSVGIVTFVGLVAIHHLFPKPEGALPD